MIAAGFTKPDGLPVYVVQPKDILVKHGHKQTYKRGCRCQPCRDANAATRRDYRARQATALCQWQREHA